MEGDPVNRVDDAHPAEQTASHRKVLPEIGNGKQRGHAATA
jgi:hypothetical protein